MIDGGDDDKRFRMRPTAMRVAEASRVPRTAAKSTGNWKHESFHSFDNEESDSSESWSKVTRIQKMRHASIEKTGYCKFECHEKSKRYPCATHGIEST
jgi:hypothetical protein